MENGDGQGQAPTTPKTGEPTMEDYRRVFSAIYDVHEDTIEMLLWEETAFPACGLRHATKQLVEWFEAHPKTSTPTNSLNT